MSQEAALEGKLRWWWGRRQKAPSSPPEKKTCQIGLMVLAMMMQYGVNNGNENDKELVLCHDLELKYLTNLL